MGKGRGGKERERGGGGGVEKENVIENNGRR